MVLAHLRGLLRPDYKMGVRSQIREELVLEALDREMQSGFIDGVINRISSLAPNPAPAKTLGKINDLTDKSYRLRGLRGVKRNRNIDGLITVYNALMKSDLAKSLRQ